MALYWYGWGDRRNPAVYGNFEIIVGPILMWFSALNPPAPPLPHNRRIARSPYTKTVDTVLGPAVRSATTLRKRPCVSAAVGLAAAPG